jgi:hypothetical protein
MNQAAAKELIKSTDYLDNQILSYKEDARTIIGKIVSKGYTASFKDEDGNHGTVRVRIKDLKTNTEFSESLTKIAKLFPKEFISNRLQSKDEILTVLKSNKEVKLKTVSWIEETMTIPEVKKKDEVESLLYELWLESKVTKARFNADADVSYNSRA